MVKHTQIIRRLLRYYSCYNQQINKFTPTNEQMQMRLKNTNITFINKGKRLLNPRISTNFEQFSPPSSPVIAYANTFKALGRLIFFSLE